MVEGGGIYLTGTNALGGSWDLAIDETRDIRTVTGNEELEKDVAYATAVAVQEHLGDTITPLVLGQIQSTVNDVLEDESRIDSVQQVDVTHIDTDTVEVVAIVRAGRDRVELVFEV
jgi:hypothetical protein